MWGAVQSFLGLPGKRKGPALAHEATLHSPGGSSAAGETADMPELEVLVFA